MKYMVEEKQNLQSKREGTEIQANSLSEAKRKASKERCFQGTVLVLKSNGREVSYKKDGAWTDV